MAKNPKPPANTRMQVVMFMTGLYWKPSSELGNNVKPTPQKELTAWKTEHKMRSYSSIDSNCVK